MSVRTCRTCGNNVPYSGFGRPREYCDTCRQDIKHRPDEQRLCPTCGWYFEGGGEWQRYCSEECRNTPTEDTRPAPPRMAGNPPYVWEVNERYLITLKPHPPKHTGRTETIRCGIVADFADEETARKYVDHHATRLQQMLA